MVQKQVNEKHKLVDSGNGDTYLTGDFSWVPEICLEVQLKLTFVHHLEKVQMNKTMSLRVSVIIIIE